MRYLHMPPAQLHQESWAWRRLLDNAASMRVARSTGRYLGRVEPIEAVARNRRIRLVPIQSQPEEGRTAT
jgi:hypothetical protein